MRKEKINSHRRSFSERVKMVVSLIPKGSVLTYQEVARRAGNPKASRAVGNVLNTNYDPDIPCHRVVRKNGLGGYNRGKDKKALLLLAEGVNVENL